MDRSSRNLTIQYGLTIHVDEDGGAQIWEALAHVAAPGDEPGLIVAPRMPKRGSHSFDFKHMVVALEWVAEPDLFRSGELREEQSDFAWVRANSSQ